MGIFADPFEILNSTMAVAALLQNPHGLALHMAITLSSLAAVLNCYDDRSWQGRVWSVPRSTALGPDRCVRISSDRTGNDSARLMLSNKVVFNVAKQSLFM